MGDRLHSASGLDIFLVYIVLLTSLLKPSSDESRLLDPLLVFLFPLPLDRSNLPLPPESKSSFDDVFLNRENFLIFPIQGEIDKSSLSFSLNTHMIIHTHICSYSYPHYTAIA